MIKTIRQAQVEAIIIALEMSKNKTQASRALGISIRKLRNWIQKEPQLKKYRALRNGEK